MVPLTRYLRADANAPTPMCGSTTLIVRRIVGSVWVDDFAAIEVSALWAITSNWLSRQPSLQYTLEATWYADLSSVTRDLHACWDVWGYFKGLLEVSWGVLEASWGVLEASWRRLGASWRCLGWSSSRCRRVLECPADFSSELEPSGKRPGGFLGHPWTFFWSLENVLGARSH